MRPEYYEQQLDRIHIQVQKAIRKQFSRVVLIVRREDPRFAKWRPDSLALGVNFPVFHQGERVKRYNKAFNSVLFHNGRAATLASLPTRELVQLLRQLKQFEVDVVNGVAVDLLEHALV